MAPLARFILAYILFACWNISLCTAQSGIVLGKEYPLFSQMDHVTEENKYYFRQNNELLTLKKSKDLLFIQKWNLDKLTPSKVHIYQDMPKGFMIEYVGKIGAKNCFFYSFKDKRTGKAKLCYRLLNVDQGIFDNKGQVILELQEDVYKYGMTSRFYFDTSFHQSKILIRYPQPSFLNEERKKFQVTGMIILDSALTLMAHEKITMQHPEKILKVVDYLIDDEGKVYILSNIAHHRKQIKQGNGTHHIELTIAGAQLKDISTQSLTAGDTGIFTEISISKIRLFTTPHRYILCGGVFHRNEDPKIASGVFTFKISDKGIPYQFLTVKIPEEMKKIHPNNAIAFFNETADAFDKPDLEDLELNDIIEYDNGELLIACEQIYFSRVTTYPKFTRIPVSAINYHFNDIYLFRITPDGNMTWSRKIPKSQSSIYGTGTLSYKYFRDSIYHYYLFVDDQKNDQLSRKEPPNTYIDGLSGVLSAYRITDATGAIKKISLLEINNMRDPGAFRIFPYRFFQLSGKELVCELTNNNNECMILRVNMDKEMFQ